METFGLDISHHQNTTLDLRRCKQESGLQFVFIKSSEGSTFIDQKFAGYLAQARQAGMLTAAYHYVRSNASAAAQVANVVKVVPKDVPVIPDVEANSGGVALVREFVAKLQAAGYHVPLTYLPRWYWQQIGSPSLVGLPSLWSSRYPDNVAGSIADEYADVPATYWNGYGGLGVTVLQFTSSLRIPSYTGVLDANVFRGTVSQLAAVLGGKEDDMAGEGPNILAAVMTGGDSTRGISLDKDGKVVYPQGVDASSVLGRLADVQFALTKLIPTIVDTVTERVVASFSAYLRDNPPTVEAVDYDVLAARLVAEFKKEGN